MSIAERVGRGDDHTVARELLVSHAGVAVANLHRTHLENAEACRDQVGAVEPDRELDLDVGAELRAAELEQTRDKVAEGDETGAEERGEGERTRAPSGQPRVETVGPGS
jgi:hypothetical protein